MPTVLIVENNEASRDTLARSLELHQYSVILAADALEGISIARAAKPDLILMDLQLQGVDGWEATARLKMDKETEHIPIIALSANAMPNDRHQALAAGGDDFDTKPVQFERLIEKIERLLVKMGP